MPEIAKIESVECVFRNVYNFVKRFLLLSLEGTRDGTQRAKFTKKVHKPAVMDSSSPQNEKLLLYRKQKSCLGSKLNFVFYTCLPHFTLGLTMSEKSGKSM